MSPTRSASRARIQNPPGGLAGDPSQRDPRHDIRHGHDARNGWKATDDGDRVEYGPGDVFFMPPGHDAWVEGDKRCVLFDFTGMEHYAKPG